MSSHETKGNKKNAETYIYQGGGVRFPSDSGVVPRKVTRAEIHHSVNSIGKCAFFNCALLESIIIPQSVTSIEDGAFKGCSKLASIEIPSSVTSIGALAFYECTSLQSITIPDSITCISIGAFYGCTSLSNVRLPSGITIIGKKAFQDCSSLCAIRIPEKVTIIGNDAFNGCTSLLAISAPSLLQSLKGGSNDNKTYHQYQHDLKVGDNAFLDCPFLEAFRQGEEKSSETCLKEHQCFKEDLALHRLCINQELTLDGIKDHLMIHEKICDLVDSSGRTALHVLAFNSSVTVDTIKELLSVGESAVQTRDSNGLYPLHYLCMNEVVTEDMVKLLLHNGDLGCKYGTPLKFAVLRNASNAVIKALQPPSLPEIETISTARSSLTIHQGELTKMEPLAADGESVSNATMFTSVLDPQDDPYNKVVFKGRFILEANPPIHKSATCRVLKGYDENPIVEYRSNFMKYSNKKNTLSKRNFHDIIKALGLRLRNGETVDDCFQRYMNKDGRMSEKEFMEFCKREVIDWDRRSVACKFMKDKAQYEREKGPRIQLCSKYVVSLNSYFEQKDDEDKAFLDYTKYPYVVLMPLADRNLDSIFRSEQPNFDQIRDYILQIAKALKHVHHQGVIHGDLKLLNIVRLRGRLMLIDFDASANIATDETEDDGCCYVGNKFSSGVIPPEMVYCIKDESELKQFYEYFKTEKQNNDEKWQKIKPIFNSKRTEAYVVKTFNTPDTGTGNNDRPMDPDQLPYDLVKATPAFDAWSLGTILFTLLAGENLFSVNRDDNIKTKQSMKDLCNWNENCLKQKLRNIPYLTVGAMDLLSQLLHLDPLQRPSMDEVIKHDFFLKSSDVQAQLDEAKENKDEGLIEELKIKTASVQTPDVEPTIPPKAQSVRKPKPEKPVERRSENDGTETRCSCVIQ